jgi:hypothetical protein
MVAATISTKDDVVMVKKKQSESEQEKILGGGGFRVRSSSDSRAAVFVRQDHGFDSRLGTRWLGPQQM